ncbi:hypothetical protein [Tenggerimyces flavus]|uniref:Uncharacterized protein n=1 Tax=Tenggerimyces flavus TaxID=1708749 RepID=A0ABV7YEP2_9ACTN|nr:hypothetical protein [Tenggerimyces flavus]MBM7788969.1 hypothetical protein [Tenggerimyces flavus]
MCEPLADDRAKLSGNGSAGMDEYEEAAQERKRLLSTSCGFCGQAPGFWCVDAGGREIRNVHRQHVIRYSQSGVRRGVLRALLVKARLL